MEYLADLTEWKPAKENEIKRFPYPTVPIRLTFHSVKQRMKHENWLRKHCSFQISPYWHRGAKAYKREAEAAIEKTETHFYALRPCGNKVIRITKQDKSSKKWSNEGFYDLTTKKIVKKQPHLNMQTMESDTPRPKNSAPVINVDITDEDELTEMSVVDEDESALDSTNQETIGS